MRTRSSIFLQLPAFPPTSPPTIPLSQLPTISMSLSYFIALQFAARDSSSCGSLIFLNKHCCLSIDMCMNIHISICMCEWMYVFMYVFFELYSQVHHSPHIVGSRMAYPLPIIHPVNFIAFTSQDARMPAAISALLGMMLDLYWVKKAMLLLPVSTHIPRHTHPDTHTHT